MRIVFRSSKSMRRIGRTYSLMKRFIVRFVDIPRRLILGGQLSK